MTDHNDYKRAMIDAGMSSVEMFYRELIGMRELRGGSCTALATDVFKLYARWCQRIHVKPATQPRFVHALRALGVRSSRLRYAIDGKRLGPHGVLTLKPAELLPLGEQIAEFRRFAAALERGALQ